MRTRPTLRALLAVVTVASAALAFPGSPANATPTSEVPTLRRAIIDSAQLRAAAKRTDQVAATATKLRGRVSEHLADQARRGRVLDERAVTAVAVPDPFQPGAEIHIVSDGAKVPESVAMVRADYSDGTSDVGVGVALVDTEQPKAAGPGVAGSGYGAARALTTNMYKYSGTCTTTWFVPTLPSDRDHKLVSCFEKWALRSTDKWVYNRWALWTPGVPNFPDTSGQTVDFTVRARPYKGHESKVVSLNDWEPRSLNVQCDTPGNVELGGSYGAISGSISIPVTRCEDYWLDINSTTRAIGIDYLRDNGAISGRPASRQMYMDVGGSYTAANTTVVPIWADYNWVTMRVCTPTTCGRENWVAKEDGW